MSPLLEVNLTVNSETITAFGVMMVAVLTAYGTLQSRQAAERVKEVAEVAQTSQVLAVETKAAVDQTLVHVNGQRTAMEALIKKLEGEKADLEGKNAELRKDIS